MKKLNLLTRGEMKKVLGGVAQELCSKYIVCTHEDAGEGPDGHYTNFCCDTWQDGLSFCRGLGYGGAVGCVEGDVN